MLDWTLNTPLHSATEILQSKDSDTVHELYLITACKYNRRKQTLHIKITLTSGISSTRALVNESLELPIKVSTGASDRSFYPIFSKKFDLLETLMIIFRSKKVLSAGSLCGHLVSSPPSKFPKRTFMLLGKYHVSVIKATEMFHGTRKLT